MWIIAQTPTRKNYLTIWSEVCFGKRTLLSRRNQPQRPAHHDGGGRAAEGCRGAEVWITIVIGAVDLVVGEKALLPHKVSNPRFERADWQLGIVGSRYVGQIPALQFIECPREIDAA